MMTRGGVAAWMKGSSDQGPATIGCFEETIEYHLVIFNGRHI